MKLFFLFVVNTLLLLCISQKLERQYIVEHSLSIEGEKDNWLNRGELIIDHSSRSGSLSIHEWNDNEIELLNKLLKSKNGYYKLKINNLIQSIRICELTKSDERIILHSDSFGNLIGFDYITSNPLCINKKTRKKNKDDSIVPQTLIKSIDVSISFGDKGDEPFIPEYEIAPPKIEQKSFFQKYVCIFIYLFII